MLSTGASEKNIERFEILGVQFSAINLNDASRVIEDLIEQKKKGYVCVCPVSTILECIRDDHFRRIVNEATLVTPDGMPSVWIGKRRGFKSMERVYGPDLMLAVCDLSRRKGYRHYFYGATDEVLNSLELKLKERFPQLNVCGKFAPPFRPLTEKEDEEIMKIINQSAPDVLWVGLGSPKQDLWISSHRQTLDVPVMLAVGAAFDFLSGAKPQAPRWMQLSGLEWLFRLCTEPARLWRRYLIGNTQFILLMLKDAIRKKMIYRPTHK